MKERIQGYFDTHKTADKLYITADGQAFIDAVKADSHAQILKDKKVKEYSRDDYEDTTDSNEAVEAAKTKLLSLDFSADPKEFNQADLLKIKNILGLQTMDNKKPTLIEALSAEQERLNEAEKTQE